MSQETLQGQASIHLDHLDYLQTVEARQAYMVLLLAGKDAGFQTVAKSYPKKRDVHFEDAGERPFALIVNRSDVLVYLRKPGLGSDPDRRAKMIAAFGDRIGGSEREMTVNISNGAEAAVAASILFNAP